MTCANSNKVVAIAIVAWLAGLIMGGGAYHLLLGGKETALQEPASQTTQQEQGGKVELRTYEPGIKVQLDKQKSADGYIRGANVLVRRAPSTESPQLALLHDGDMVRVWNVMQCTDKQAAIVDGTVAVTFNGQPQVLKRGQAIRIIGEQAEGYDCLLQLDDVSGTVKIPKEAVRRVAGDTWYEVQLGNGDIGYVYGDYLETDLK